MPVPLSLTGSSVPWLLTRLDDADLAADEHAARLSLQQPHDTQPNRLLALPIEQMKERPRVRDVDLAVELLERRLRVEHVGGDERRLQLVEVAEQLVAQLDEIVLQVRAIEVLGRRAVVGLAWTVSEPRRGKAASAVESALTSCRISCPKQQPRSRNFSPFLTRDRISSYCGLLMMLRSRKRYAPMHGYGCCTESAIEV